MFGSISSWVNENVPKPSMPTMPSVNMPSMPAMPTVNMPGIFNKSKEGTEENPANKESEVKPDPDAVQVDTDDVKSEPDVPQKEESDAVKISEESEKLVEEMTEEEATKNGGYKHLESAKEIGKNMGNMLFSFGSKATNNIRSATTSVKDVIQKKTIIGDFSKENEKFVNEKKKKLSREEAAVPPWVGYNEEEKLKEQILALSADSRNFLRPPPSGVDFEFNFNLSYPVAMVLLDEDPALSEMRFKLVPKQVKEENFWLNYFYRVSLIKQSTTLDELSKQNLEGNSESKDPKSASQTNTPKQDTIEFVSDTYDQDLNDEDIKNELKQLNLDNKKDDDDIDDTEWDIKPEDMDNISPEELEKEINSMLG